MMQLLNHHPVLNGFAFPPKADLKILSLGHTQETNLEWSYAAETVTLNICAAALCLYVLSKIVVGHFFEGLPCLSVAVGLTSYLVWAWIQHIFYECFVIIVFLPWQINLYSAKNKDKWRWWSPWSAHRVSCLSSVKQCLVPNMTQQHFVMSYNQGVLHINVSMFCFFADNVDSFGRLPKLWNIVAKLDMLASLQYTLQQLKWGLIKWFQRKKSSLKRSNQVFVRILSQCSTACNSSFPAFHPDTG